MIRRSVLLITQLSQSHALHVVDLFVFCFIPRLNFLVSYSSDPSPGIFFICKHVGRKIRSAKMVCSLSAPANEDSKIQKIVLLAVPPIKLLQLKTIVFTMQMSYVTTTVPLFSNPKTIVRGQSAVCIF